MIILEIFEFIDNSAFSIAWNIVTAAIDLPYNPEINFSLNLIKSGSGMALHISCFALLATFFTFLNSSVFSQTKGSIRQNFTTSTPQVPTVLPSKSKLFPLTSPVFFFNSTTKNEIITVVDSCGSGAQGGEVTNANGNSNVSPDSKVNNPLYAIDGDLSTYSELHIDVQQKDVEVIQKISFTGTTYPTDIVKLTLSIGTTLFNYKITAQAYDNNTPVGTVQDITSSLTLYPTTVVYTFNPGVIFNQVRIGVIALQNGNHIASINLHEISLTAPPAPQSSGGGGGGGGNTSSTVSTCEGNVVLTVDNPTAGVVYNWYDSSNTKVSSSSATSYSPPNLSAGSYTYYVAAARATTCTVESDRHTINLTVNPKPATPSIATN